MKIHFEFPNDELDVAVQPLAEAIIAAVVAGLTPALTACVAELVAKAPAVAAAPKATRTRKAKTEDVIEQRPVDPAVATQDAVDEAAERQAADEGDLTRDDVRAAVLRLSDAVGMADALRSIEGIIGCRVDDLHDTPDDFAKAIVLIDNAIEDAKIRKPAPAAEPTAAEAKEFGATLAASLFGDAPAPTPPTPPPPATKADVIDAFKKYAAAFDKTDDMAKAKFTLEDGPKILMQSVGVTRVSEIAEVDYGAAVKAVYFAIDNDLFSRMGAK